MEDWGTPVVAKGTKNISQSYTMVPGMCYESVYSVGGLRTFFPGWEQEAISNIRDAIENNPNFPQGTCVTKYIRVEEDGTCVAQWKYNPIDTTTLVIPAIVGYIVLAVAAAIIVYLVWQVTESVKEILTSENPNTRYAIIVAGVVAAAVLLVAAAYSFRSISDTYKGLN